MENIIDKFIGSEEMYEKINRIGEHHNLHIDQLGELGSEITLVLKGKNPTSNFIDNVSSRLEIDKAQAEKIVEDINTEIILPLRQGIVEGNHKIETPDEILKHIEDGGLELPAPEQPIPAPAPTPAPEPAPTPEKTEPQSENLTEHLLNNAVISPKVEKKYTVDPYREPVE